jgi:hypothetical protein
MPLMSVPTIPLFLVSSKRLMYNNLVSSGRRLMAYCRVHFGSRTARVIIQPNPISPRILEVALVGPLGRVVGLSRTPTAQASERDGGAHTRDNRLSGATADDWAQGW